MISKNKQVCDFLNYVKQELKNNKIKLVFYKNPEKLDKNFQIYGYFDETKIAVLRDKNWLSTLVHEFGHFIQWKNKSKTYTAYTKTKTDPVELTEKYLLSEKQKLTRRVKTAFRIIRENEYECDQIGVQIIKDHKLPLSIEEYVKRSNHQIIYYHAIEKYKNTIPHKGFDTKQFINKLPRKFYKSYVYEIPDHVKSEVSKYFAKDT